MKPQKLTLGLFALMGIYILSGCEKDEETPQLSKNIVEIAQAEPDLSSLVAVLTKFPDLVTNPEWGW